MESRATLRYNRQSPFKVRKVLNAVRGKNVGSAVNYLHFSPEKASLAIEKTIRSALANLMQNEEASGLDPDLVKIKEAYVNQGPVMKRFRPRAQGRAFRIQKATSHITIVLAS